MITKAGPMWLIGVGTVSGLGTGLLLGRALAKREKMAGEQYQQTLRAPGESEEGHDADHVRQIEWLRERVKSLVEEYGQLQAKYDRTVQQTRDEQRLAVYHALETVLLQLPGLASDLHRGASVDPQVLASILEAIPRRLQTLGVEQLEEVGGITRYDPALHKPLPTVGFLAPGTPVTVIIPGFRYQDDILARAQVDLAGEV